MRKEIADNRFVRLNGPSKIPELTNTGEPVETDGSHRDDSSDICADYKMLKQLLQPKRSSRGQLGNVQFS